MTKKGKKKPELREENEELEGQEAEEGWNEEDAEHILSSTRAPRQGIYEHLLSQLMAQAIVIADPLKRVKAVCEAALMVQPDEREDLEIDYEKVTILNAVANALLNPTVRRFDQIEVVSIPWGFSETEQNFAKYVKPWFTCQIYYWPSFLKTHVKMHRNYYNRIIIDEIVRNPFWSWFFDASSCLCADGYAALRNNFAAWAIPQVQLFLAELTKKVSPGLYSQILGVYQKRGSRTSESVRETAEASADADNMGSF